MLFLPLAQQYTGNVTLMVRSVNDPKALGAEIQQIVRQLDPDLPLNNIRTMEQQLARSPNALMPMRMGAMAAAAQGAITLLLAALGIFGLVSFAVTRRTREIGIRMAMGASRTDVLRLVAMQPIRHTAIGLACGFLMAFGVTRLLAGLLLGVSPTDPVVFAGTALFIAAIAMLACWLPARRAAAFDPMLALRAE